MCPAFFHILLSLLLIPGKDSTNQSCKPRLMKHRLITSLCARSGLSLSSTCCAYLRQAWLHFHTCHPAPLQEAHIEHLCRLCEQIFFEFRENSSKLRNMQAVMRLQRKVSVSRVRLIVQLECSSAVTTGRRSEMPRRSWLTPEQRSLFIWRPQHCVVRLWTIKTHEKRLHGHSSSCSLLGYGFKRRFPTELFCTRKL